MAVSTSQRPRSAKSTSALTSATPLWTAVDALGNRATRDAARALVITELEALEQPEFRGAILRLKTSMTSCGDEECRQQYWLCIAGAVTSSPRRFDSALLSALLRAACDEVAFGANFQGPAALFCAISQHSGDSVDAYAEIITPLVEFTSARQPTAVQTSASACLAAVLSSWPCNNDALFRELLEALMCCAVNTQARSHLYNALNHLAHGNTGIVTPDSAAQLIRYALLSLKEFSMPGRVVGEASCAAERVAVAECVGEWAAIVKSLVLSEGDATVWQSAHVSLCTLARYDKSDGVRRACASAAVAVQDALSTLAVTATTATISQPVPSTRVSRTAHRRYRSRSQSRSPAPSRPSTAASARAKVGVDVESPATVSTINAPATPPVAATAPMVPSSRPPTATGKATAVVTASAAPTPPVDESSFILDVVIATHQTLPVGIHKGLGPQLSTALKSIPATQLSKLKPSTLPTLLVRLVIDLLAPTLTDATANESDWRIALPWLIEATLLPALVTVLSPFAAKVSAALVSGPNRHSDIATQVSAWSRELVGTDSSESDVKQAQGVGIQLLATGNTADAK